MVGLYLEIVTAQIQSCILQIMEIDLCSYLKALGLIAYAAWGVLSAILGLIAWFTGKRDWPLRLGVVLSILFFLFAPYFAWKDAMVNAERAATEKNQVELRKLNDRVAEEVSRQVSDRMRAFDLAEPLFAVLPSDIDFLSRGNQIRREVGRSLRLTDGRAGRTDNDLTIAVSAIRTDPDKGAIALLTVRGRTDFRNSVDVELEIALKRGAVERFLAPPSYEFYLFIEDESFESHIEFAIARRKMKTVNDIQFFMSGARYKGPKGVGQIAELLNAPPPRPILIR